MWAFVGFGCPVLKALMPRRGHLWLAGLTLLLLLVWGIGHLLCAYMLFWVIGAFLFVGTVNK